MTKPGARPAGGARRSGWLRRPGVIVVALALAHCGPKAGSDAGPAARGGQAAVPVTVATVVRQDVPIRVRAIGNVEAYATVSIRSQVEGQLAEAHLQEGSEVRKGDLLFTIDPRPFAAALRQAEATLARDRIEAQNARVEAGRRTRLFEQGFVSRDEYEQAETRAAALRATVGAEEAAVENARLELQYCSIRSPLDGRVGQVLVHAGNVVKANETTLAVIHQIRPADVAFAVPERELPAIRARAAAEPLAVEVAVPGAGGAPLVGSLSFIDNAVDRTTGTVLLKGRFANDDELLWPGQFVDVALVLGVQAQVVVEPAEAMQAGQKGAYAFVVKPDLTVEARPVVVGSAAGTGVVVESGLEAGERVVTDGQIRLAPGTKVEIRGETATGGRSSSSSAR